MKQAFIHIYKKTAGSKMKIALIQNEVFPSFSKTFEHIKSLITQAVSQKPDVILLGELWNTPYDNDMIVQATSYQDTCLTYLQQISQDYHLLMVGGSIPFLDKGHIYNRCFIFDHGHLMEQYDKTHLLEVHTHQHHYQEKDVFSKGDHLSLISYQNQKIGIEICYDIRFPECSRILTEKGAQIIFCPAAFNASVGPIHWRSLLQTRAMENQVFMVGVSPSQYTYEAYTSYGHSMIVDPFGKVIIEMDEKPGFQIFDIDVSKVESTRKRMPFWSIRRTDLYTIKEN